MRLLAVLILFLVPQDGGPDPIAIRDAKIVVGPDQTLERGTLILRNGVIESVGEDIEIPFDAEVIDGKGLTVYAGFIDGHSRIGLPTDPRGDESRKAAEGRQPDAMKGPIPRTREANRKGTHPDFRAAMVVTVKDEDLKKHHKAGFTSLLAAPPGRILGGTSALLSLNGLPRRSSIIKPDLLMHAGLRVGGEGYPRTLMGILAHLRQFVHDTRLYRTRWKEYNANPEGKARPPYDPAFESFLPVLDGKRPLAFGVDSLNNIRRAIAFGKEFGIKVWIVGGGEAHLAVKDLKDADIPVLLTLKWPDEPKWEKKDLVPKKLHEERTREWEARKHAAIALEKAGVRFCFTTHDVSPGDALKNVRALITAGLSEQAALRALTESAAGLFGTDKVSGRVEKGREANLVVLTGSLADKKSRVKFAFADGRKFEYEIKDSQEKPEIDVTGEWKVTVTTDQGDIEIEMSLKQNGADVTGTMTSEMMGETEIEDGKVSGKSVSFAVTVDMGGESITFKISGDMKGDSMSGTVNSPMGENKWKASKVDP